MKTFIEKNDLLNNNETHTAKTKTDEIKNNFSNLPSTSSTNNSLIIMNKHESDRNYIDLKKYKLNDALINEKFNRLATFFNNNTSVDDNKNTRFLLLKDEINLCKYGKCKLKR